LIEWWIDVAPVEWINRGQEQKEKRKSSAHFKEVAKLWE
jgi:hypothetical protein